jgi:hypothetical protein
LALRFAQVGQVIDATGQNGFKNAVIDQAPDRISAMGLNFDALKQIDETEGPD